MTARAYFVEGVALVNCGGELCDACGERKAVGASVSGHLLCPRCAGLHAHFAEELAREKEESAKRKEAAFSVFQRSQRNRNAKRLPPNFRCGHSVDPTNVYTLPQSGWHICRTCQSKRLAEAKAKRRKAR